MISWKSFTFKNLNLPWASFFLSLTAKKLQRNRKENKKYFKETSKKSQRNKKERTKNPQGTSKETAKILIIFIILFYSLQKNPSILPVFFPSLYFLSFYQLFLWFLFYASFWVIFNSSFDKTHFGEYSVFRAKYMVILEDKKIWTQKWRIQKKFRHQNLGVTTGFFTVNFFLFFILTSFWKNDCSAI